jgi:hypothetical protein
MKTPHNPLMPYLPSAHLRSRDRGHDSYHDGLLHCFKAAAVLALGIVSASVHAEDYLATPQDYREVLGRLQPGDALVLAPGRYYDNLPLHDLAGTAAQPITIRGSSGPEPTTFVARDGANTVSLKDSAYLIVDALVLDGYGREADAVKAESSSKSVHHITLSRLTIINYDLDQATVGISAHCATWGWIIRDNVIDGAGTGLYLGRSDGTAPFVGGLIEGNVVRNTKGYNLQIKHQIAREALPGMPRDRQETVIRNNVFVKSQGAAEAQSARPNVLVGHFPPSGLGSTDTYVIYANLFYDNPTEALFQGEGNTTLYNNVFVNPRGAAVHIQPHNGRPRHVQFFHNTVVARDAGVHITGVEQGHHPVVFGNAVFSNQPASIALFARDNTAMSWAQARDHLRAPFLEPPALDVSPKEDALIGSHAVMHSSVLHLPGWDLDFDGVRRERNVAGAFTHRQHGRPLDIE